MTAKHINWAKVENIYRAGLLTVTEIARECGLTEGAIRRRAKKSGWNRDLAARVRAKTKQNLITVLADQSENTAKISREDDQSIIDLALATQVTVVREHRASIRRGHALTKRLMDELNATTSHVGELEDLILNVDEAKQRHGLMRAVSLPARAAVMRDLAQAARVWVSLERQSFWY